MDRRRHDFQGRQSVRHRRRHRRIRAGRQGADRTGGGSGARRLPGMGDVRRAGTRRPARQGRQRNHRAQGRTRQTAVARRRQDAAGRHRRSGAGRQRLQVLCRRSAAPFRRTDSVRASRHRRRTHARTGRRGRHHCAVEFPGGDSRPGRSRRRWPTATAWCSSRPTWCRAWRTRSRRSSSTPAFRRAFSIS